MFTKIISNRDMDLSPKINRSMYISNQKNAQDRVAVMSEKDVIIAMVCDGNGKNGELVAEKIIQIIGDKKGTLVKLIKTDFMIDAMIDAIKNHLSPGEQKAKFEFLSSLDSETVSRWTEGAVNSFYEILTDAQQEILNDITTNYRNKLLQQFIAEEIHSKFTEDRYNQSGSTMSLVLVDQEGRLITLHLGDSTIAVGNSENGGHLQISTPHKAEDGPDSDKVIKEVIASWDT